MAFDWYNFLELAEELAAREDDEASKRTAISRAYYSAFNVALQRAKLMAWPRPPKPPIHQWCWREYQAAADPASRELGNIGHRMKRKRTQADYEKNDWRRIDEDVLQVIEDARGIPARLAALPPLRPRH
jgi:uncharacterized protein (UPF0332 family)